MEERHNYITGTDRYLFDGELGRRGFSQLVSANDGHQRGRWLNAWMLQLVEYDNGNVTSVQFEDVAECVGWLLVSRDVIGLEHIVDFYYAEIPIQRFELELYISFHRDDG